MAESVTKKSSFLQTYSRILRKNAERHWELIPDELKSHPWAKQTQWWEQRPLPTGVLDSAEFCSELGPTLHQQMPIARTKDARVLLSLFPFSQHRHMAKSQTQTPLFIITKKSTWLGFHFSFANWIWSENTWLCWKTNISVFEKVICHPLTPKIKNNIICHFWVINFLK